MFILFVRYLKKSVNAENSAIDLSTVSKLTVNARANDCVGRDHCRKKAKYTFTRIRKKQKKEHLTKVHSLYSFHRIYIHVNPSLKKRIMTSKY